MHRYRSHTCAALTTADVGNNVRLSGWVHRVRDHGGLLFIDLRDHYGTTQLVIDPDSAAFKLAETVRLSVGLGLAVVLARRDYVIELSGATSSTEQVVISPHPVRAVIWTGFDFDLLWR